MMAKEGGEGGGLSLLRFLDQDVKEDLSLRHKATGNTAYTVCTHIAITSDSP